MEIKMFKSSDRHMDLGLDTALVFSATENNLRSDLVAVKAAFLYSEKVKLASARLYYCLLAMHAHKKSEEYQEKLQNCIDDLMARRGRKGDGQDDKRLREYLEVFMDQTSLDGVYSSEIDTRMINIPLPSRSSLSAMIELAEGSCSNAFDVLPYDDVVRRTVDFMRGDVSPLEVIPVFDQSTFKRLDGLTNVTLHGVEDARGPRAELDDQSSYRGLLATDFLAHINSFPRANWGVLHEMRDELEAARRRFLSTMNDLAKGLEAGAAPKKVSEFAHKQWMTTIRAELADIREKEKSEKSRSRLVGSGLPNLLLGIGVAATVLAEHHMPYYALGTAAALGVQQFALERNERQKIRRDVRFLPYWFLYRASDRWEPPTWPLVSLNK